MKGSRANAEEGGQGDEPKDNDCQQGGKGGGKVAKCQGYDGYIGVNIARIANAVQCDS